MRSTNAATCRTTSASQACKPSSSSLKMGRSRLEAIARHRVAAIPHGRNDRSDDEDHRLAAALSARLSCRRGAQAPQAQARLEEGGRQPGLPDRERRSRQQQFRTIDTRASLVTYFVARIAWGKTRNPFGFTGAGHFFKNFRPFLRAGGARKKIRRAVRAYLMPWPASRARAV